MWGRNRLLLLLVPCLAILLGFALYDYVYVPVRNERQNLSELKESKQKTLEKVINAIGQKEALQRRISALKEDRKSRDTELVEGQTSAVAAANLQNIIREVVTGKGGTISSERMEKPEDRGRFRMISVSVDAMLPETQALHDVIASLGNHPVTLAVQELDVRVRNVNEPRELMVKFKVSALSARRGT